MQLCVLFAIVTTLVATDVAPNADVVFVWHKLAAVLLSQALVVVAAWGIAARTVADVDCQHLPAERIRDRLEFGNRLHLCIWVCVSALILSVFQWPQIVSQAFGNSILLDKLAALTPIFLPLVPSWGLFYEADRLTARHASRSSRWDYVTNHVRSFLLLPLLPVLTVLGFSDVFETLLPQFAASSYAGVVRAAPLVFVILGFPLLIRLLWQAAPLEPGPIRSRLQAKADDWGVYMRDILVWHTDSRSVNAAVCGFVPQWRYVLLTDRLLEDLSPRQVEMVFLHEMGHAHLRHSLKLMAATAATLGGGVLSAASVFGSWGDRLDSNAMVNSLVLVAAVLSSLLFIGRYARLLELEADLWAASRIDADAESYLRALAKVAGGGSPDRASWLHPSFARRCEFLLQGLEPASVWLTCRLRIATALLVATVATVLAYAAIC